MKSLRILLYAVNGLGMGHITRQLAIAKYLRRYAMILGYQPEIAFLSTSEVDTLPFQHGFPVFKIPSKTIVQNGSMNPQRYQKMAKMMIWNCIAGYDPHILVVDTFPTGSFDELYDVMDFGFKKAFVYRPRKDSRKLWKNPIMNAYDRILYINEQHEPEELQIQIESDFGGRVRQVGAIVQRDKTELLDRQTACQQLGLDPQQRQVCILAGGGGDKDNQAFFERMLPLLKNNKKTQLVAAAGPLYLGKELPQENCRWFYRADIALYWNAFDFVIAAGGYNSVNELLHVQCPSLFFAQHRLYDNQAARIEALAAQGLCLQFSLEQSDEEIATAIARIANKNSQKALKQKLQQYNLQNEAGKAAIELLKLVEKEDLLSQIEDLLDMAQLRRLLQLGIDEVMVCKCIRAFWLFQTRINTKENNHDYIDNEELGEALEAFLTDAARRHIPKNELLPALFEQIKKEEIDTLEKLLAASSN